jgi:succinyl-CoA synthetase alpha subunit
MHHARPARSGVERFKYFVGVQSLAQVASREDRVCVLNILGAESREVTPVNHAYSGGNVVFGTSPGKGGATLPTPAGDIPVFNNVREGLVAGHAFNTGVVYLPPSAARDGVAELVRVNPDLAKIFIITEKIAVRDAREIRAMAQAAGVDVFGANGLGAADAWHQVRIGGALGGEQPAQALRRGSIAVFSNSGGFCSTIAHYLRMAGWGTTTLISSGKDLYIHYAAPEFAHALAHDERSKAAVLYCEPGGYYELDADFTKPVVACVVGRWKSRLTRAVGHAGALAGGHDDAQAKEAWFMRKFGVDALFTPLQPVFSARGAVVNDIAHIPAALNAVMQAQGIAPDFAPEGCLALKPWFGSDEGLALPAALALPVVAPAAPYAAQVARLNAQIGASLPRQVMKDASGASQVDASTQVGSLHRTSTLAAARLPLEANIALALLHEAGGLNDRRLIAAAVAAHVNLHGRPTLAAAQASREAGNAPNAVAAAALAIAGPGPQRAAREAMHHLLEGFHAAGLGPAYGAALSHRFEVDGVTVHDAHLLTTEQPDARAQALLAGVRDRDGQSVFLRWLCALPGHPTEAAVLAAICATLAWGPLARKRITRATAQALPWWMQLFGTAIGAFAPAHRHEPGHFCGLPQSSLLGRAAPGEIAFNALFGRPPAGTDLHDFEVLTGLLLTHGPGTLSAQGAKGAVSADGPEAPGQVQLNKALLGFLAHTGFAHGGHSRECLAFLCEQFRTTRLRDPGAAHPGVDLDALATAAVAQHAQLQRAPREDGSVEMARIPGLNHPVAKDKPAHHDPRERHVAALLAERGEHNVFHAFFRTFVGKLFEAGVSRKVCCVNDDAVIASLLLKMLWGDLQSGRLAQAQLEDAAFTMFLLSRMLGCAAEIDDHMNRGRNLDTRTPATQCRHVI